MQSWVPIQTSDKINACIHVCMVASTMALMAACMIVHEKVVMAEWHNECATKRLTTIMCRVHDDWEAGVSVREKDGGANNGNMCSAGVVESREDQGGKEQVMDNWK